jgi:hypothetical protein
MILVETVPEMGERVLKTAAKGLNSSMIHFIHFKNFCKNSNVHPSSTIT